MEARQIYALKAAQYLRIGKKLEKLLRNYAKIA